MTGTSIWAVNFEALDYAVAQTLLQVVCMKFNMNIWLFTQATTGSRGSFAK